MPQMFLEEKKKNPRIVVVLFCPLTELPVTRFRRIYSRKKKNPLYITNQSSAQILFSLLCKKCTLLREVFIRAQCMGG